MTKTDLLQTNDAMVWAKEFVRIMKKNNWKLKDIDEGLMVGWFANAMYAQEIKMTTQIQNEHLDLCATIWFTNDLGTIVKRVK